MSLKFTDFWYIVALSKQVKPHNLISRTVLGEWLVIFRDQNGQPVALQDRCLHRNSRLSCGRITQGKIQCPYHGWVYNEAGKVIEIPSEGFNFPSPNTRNLQHYATKEQDGYIYVRLAESPSEYFQPFSMPHYQEKGWETVRVINRFQNNVTNCVENFIDIPHTVFVHPRIFRNSRQQRLEMVVKRSKGCVCVEYYHETTNLGWFSYFLNRQNQEIRHTDSFYMPNITSVAYMIEDNRQLFITSQSIPETENSTLVYTDVTFNYGFWNQIARPFVHWTAQKIIKQDIKILGIQGEVIAKYGTNFSHTSADTIHIFVESIRNNLAEGKDPRMLPEKLITVNFWV
jgi:phenylpropionate dioxygenase-like ring-hydroxylating dioxygenase large terminal subunit